MNKLTSNRIDLNQMFARVFAAMASLVLFPLNAFAQSGIPEVKGVSATVAAAALETAGYQMQAIVLQDLGTMLQELGTLLYIAAFILGIMVFAIFRAYEEGYWLLIGPGLFYFVVGTTVPASGAEWQFGQRTPLGGEEVNEYLEDLVDGEVSYVFAHFNNLISNIVQQLVGLIAEPGQDDQASLRRQLMLAVRPEIMQRLFQIDITDPGVRALTEFGMKGTCAKVSWAMQRMGHARRMPDFANYEGSSEYQEAVKILEEDFGDISDPDTWRKRHQLEGQAREGARDILRMLDSDLDPRPEALDTCVQTADMAAPNATVNAPVSCAQIWCWTAAGLYYTVKREQGHINNSLLRVPMEEGEDELIEEIWQSIAAKLTPVPPTELEPDPVQPETSLVPLIIGGVILRKNLRETMDMSMLQQLAEHAGWERQTVDFRENISFEQSQELLRRMRSHAQAVGARQQIFTFTMTLPYLQGMFLYLLAVSFPFFALLLLVPGYAGGFFLWMTLWIWVKAWDIGWAIAMVADDVIWALMPKTAVFNQDVDPRDQPVELLAAAFDGDPAYNLANYYGVMTVVLTAIPIVTGQMVIGGKAIMSNVLVGGMNDLSESFGFVASKWTLHDHTQRVDLKRELFALNKAIDGLQNGTIANNNDVKQLYKEAQQIKDSGGAWKTAGYVAGGALMIGAGALLTASVIGAPLGIFLISAGAFGGYSAVNAGWNKEEAYHGMMADANKANAQALYYEAAQSNFSRTMDTMRGGLSGRGEYWNMADTKIAASNIAKQALEVGRAKNTAATVGGVVGVGFSVIPGVGGWAGRVAAPTASKFGGRIASTTAGQWVGRNMATPVGNVFSRAAQSKAFQGRIGTVASNLLNRGAGALYGTALGRASAVFGSAALGFAGAAVAAPIGNWLMTNYGSEIMSAVGGNELFDGLNGVETEEERRKQMRRG